MLDVLGKILYKDKKEVYRGKGYKLLRPRVRTGAFRLTQEEYPADYQENPQRFLQRQFFSQEEQGKEEGKEGICPHDGNHP